MAIPVPRTTQRPPQIKTLDNNDWLNGTVTAFDDGRTPLNGLRNSGNVYLDQSGTVRPRPSLVPYGPQPLGKVLGEIYEFKKVTGLATESWLICMQSFNVSVSPSASVSPSHSVSPSASLSPSSSISASTSPSSSISPSSSLSPSASTSLSPSSSLSPSASASPSASVSPSSSVSPSLSPSSSLSPSASVSPSISPSSSRSPSASLSPSASVSISPSASRSPSASISASPSAPVTAYAQIFVARGEDTSWTAVTGAYFDDEASAHFCQIAGVVLIMNGVDHLAYYDISGGTVVPYTALSTPGTPTIANNGSTDLTTASTFTIYYAVTANSSVGETAASAAASQGITTDRDLWSSSQSLKITWTAVSNAKSYNIYMAQVAPGGSPQLFLLSSGLNTTAFIDDGSLVPDFTTTAPTVDSTAGPRCSRGVNINGRAYLVGDADHPYYVRNGGDPGFELDFSPANGGGWTLISTGSQNIPINIQPFRDAQGHPQITVLCQGLNGRGKRFTLTPDSVTYGTQTIEFFDVQEESGQDGTDSPDAVILYQDALWYPSRDGFKTTGTKPQLQNVLMTDRISNTIQRDIALLNSSAMGGAVGMGFEGRLYWALPVDASANNEIWVLDLQRGGAWMKPWNVAADWLMLYNDNSGNTHMLAMQDNKIYEFSYASLTNDNGTAFSTSGQSGIIRFSPDGRQWADLLQVVFTVLEPQGEITFEISGKTDDSDGLVALGSTTLDALPKTNPAGWSEAAWGSYAWSSFPYVPVPTNNAQEDVIVEVGEEVQYFEYSWNSVGAGTDYQISAVIGEYVPLGIRDLS